MDDPQDPPIRRVSLVDEIVVRLREEILGGRYEPGQALPAERQLAAAYSVTRASLKNALVRLEDLGLIRTRHGIGSIVQDVEKTAGADLLQYILSPKDRPDDGILGDLLEARSLTSGAFARLAARRRTKQDLDHLASLIDQLEAPPDDLKEIQRIEYAFMRDLSRAARNKAFIFVTNSVATAYWAHRSLYAAQYAEPSWVADQLRRILEAVRARDEHGAQTAMEDYQTEGGRKILEERSKKRKRKKRAR